jgi:hypothetical protein
MNLNVVVPKQNSNAIQETTLFDVKRHFRTFAHFLGSGQNISQAIQLDNDSLGFLGLQYVSAKWSNGTKLIQQSDLLDIAP